jgi:hypothetical protein
MSSKTCLYLTYLGYSPSSLEQGLKSRDFEPLNLKQGYDPSSSVFLPILENVPVGYGPGIGGRAPFSTLMPGCGTIELRQYGVLPYPRRGMFFNLSEAPAKTCL